ncbi:MAG: hypothetical protein U9R66_11545 [Thermodesulfobacteriota bacterium]|nr:hypothetical protein [Thermodesulfobacteriota bacterium]
MKELIGKFILDIASSVCGDLAIDTITKPNLLKCLRKACAKASQIHELIHCNTYLALNTSSGNSSNDLCATLESNYLNSGLPSNQELMDLLLDCWRVRKEDLDPNHADKIFTENEDIVEPIISDIAIFFNNELEQIDVYRNRHTIRALRKIHETVDFKEIKEIELNENNLQEIEKSFFRHTDRKINKIKKHIPGIASTLPRDEVRVVEEQLSLNQPVVLTGEAGTGKSVIGSILSLRALEQDLLCLYWDLRSTAHIRDEAQLSQYFQLTDSFLESVKVVTKNKKCRIIIDQLDNILGSESIPFITDLILETEQIEGVEIVLISRKRESHESHLIEQFTDSGFVELTSFPIDESVAENILAQLNITNPPNELLQLSCNLLNLSIVGKIIELNPGINFSTFNDEVTLWESYRQAILERETQTAGLQNAELLLAEAIRLAKEGLNTDDRSFEIDYPASYEQARLISWGILVCNNRICSFSHEKLQDFLYAWDATQRELMPLQVINEISEHKTRNIFTWMTQIYSDLSSELYTQFLGEIFNA